MKKFLKITAVILSSLLIFFVGTFKYRQYKANEVSIPKNATSLVKINVDEIYKSLAVNMISNPGYYLQSDKKVISRNKENKFDTGLKIPASIYFYTIEGKPKTAIFSRLAISDFQEFSNFIKNTLKLNITKASGLNLAKNNYRNFSILFNEGYAAIALSTQTDEFEPILKDILNKKDFIKVGDSKFSSVKNSSEHLAFAQGEHFATLNFDNGAINFRDEFVSENIIPASKPLHRRFSSESTISFWLNADFKTTKKQTLKLKNTNLEQDSLAKYYKGYLDFEWLNTTQQTDSIITYDYNDDFEKVEKLTLQKTDIPNFALNISADANGLKDYLRNRIIINSDSGIINKSVFPLYKIFVGGDNKQLVLSTNKKNISVGIDESTDDFFGLNINFLKLNREINIPVLSHYFKALMTLTLRGKAVSGTVKINGKIDFVNEDINSLYQLLKSM